METSPKPLTDYEKKVLTRYAQVLKQYVTPEISGFSPIGWRKIPKIKRVEAERVYHERNDLEKRAGLCHGEHNWGHYRLDFQSEGEQSTDDYLIGYWQIFPLKADRKEVLDFLADSILQEKFPTKRFSVRSMMIPCNGDCSWDCA
jgi:hypothetical protein